MPNINNLRRFGVATMIVAGAAFTARAEESGNMAVTVRDSAGAPISNALVSITSPTMIGGARTGRTDTTGKARFPFLYPGVFQVQVTADGFQPSTARGINVKLSQTVPVDIKIAKVTGATVEVVAAAIAVDTTTATSSTNLRLETVESLPTGRTYTEYLKLAPGIIANPSSLGDFALAGSLSRSNTGDSGARNNTYVLDGVDTTNPNNGYAMARFNSEIIQEQEVKTGGISADTPARGGGAVSNVVTKSGSNTWAGSLNYYFQNANLVTKREPHVVEVVGERDKFSSFDTAFTLGGPILKDRWWFFTSVQKKNTTTEGNFADTATPVLTAKDAEQDDLLAFFKTTFQIVENHRLDLSATINETSDKSLGSSRSAPSRDFDRDTDQKIWSLSYQGNFGNLVLQGKYFGFENDRKIKPVTAFGAIDVVYPNTPFGDVPASSNPIVNAYDKQFGGLGDYTDTLMKRQGFSVDATYFLSGLLGDHTFKVGVLSQEESRRDNLQNSGGMAGDYENIKVGSLVPTLRDVFDTYTGSSWGSDENYVMSTLADLHADPAYAQFAAYVNTLAGATLNDRLAAIPVGTPDSRNPAWGNLNYRIHINKSTPSTTKRKTLEYYAQDNWTLPNNLFSLTLGARMGQDSYFASDGSELHKTDWNFAPRLGLTYNHKGEGRIKLYANYGKYFEPIKLNMANFAGTLGTERVEELFVGGTYNNWLPMRYRGGTTVFDALMAPSLQAPYTEETRLGIQQDLGSGWNWEGIYTHRIDLRSVEDFDLGLYTDPASLEVGPTTLSRIQSVYGGTDAYWQGIFRSLAYPLSHFGLSSIPSNYNYVLANMIGGKREFDTFEGVLRYNSSTWNFMADYIFSKAKGNTLSSGDADLQGDLQTLDPRLPWMNGYMVGSSDHQFKTYATYTFQEGWTKGLTLGGTFTYIAPPRYSRANATYGRAVSGPFFANFDPETGMRLGHPINQLDLRVKYNWKIWRNMQAEVFLDIFNATDRQTPTDVEETIQGTELFSNPTAFQAPRAFYLGARISF